MISNIKGVLHRTNPLVVAATLILAALIPVLAARQASAWPLTDRSLMVSSTVPSNDNNAPDGTTYTFGGGGGEVPAGDPRNGTKVDHIYTFRAGTTGPIDGITIEYCETAFGFVGTGACTATNLLANTGFSASAWGSGTVSIGANVYNITANAANFITLIPNASATSVTAGDLVTVTFTATENDYFRNPNSSYLAFSNGTYFAHISTFADDALATAAYAHVGNAPPGVIDNGTVTNNITQAISIYTRVQETLNFSVEGDYNGGTPDGPSSAYTGGACTPLDENDNLLRIGDSNNALNPGQAYYGRSYFRLATNAFQGTTVYYSGDTLKYGANTIDEITLTPAASSPGTEQFGFGFDLADPLIGTGGGQVEVDNLIGSGTTETLVPETPYADVDGSGYAFTADSVADPEPLASVSNNVVACDTGSLEYVANIGTATPAGIYTTKINFIAAPTY